MCKHLRQGIHIIFTYNTVCNVSFKDGTVFSIVRSFGSIHLNSVCSQSILNLVSDSGDLISKRNGYTVHCVSSFWSFNTCGSPDRIRSSSTLVSWVSSRNSVHALARGLVSSGSMEPEHDAQQFLANDFSARRITIKECSLVSVYFLAALQ